MATRLFTAGEERLAFVQERFLQGMDAVQIHQSAHRHGLHISVNQVNQDIRYLKSRMRNLRKTELTDHADKELFVLQEIRNKALNSFNASLNPVQVTETSHDVEVDSGGPAGNQMHQQIQALLGGGGERRKEKRSTRTKSTESTGDPRHLQVALAASNEIRKMLGLDAKEIQKVEIEVKNANLITADEFAKLSASELARIIAEETSKAQDA